MVSSIESKFDVVVDAVTIFYELECPREKSREELRRVAWFFGA